MQLLNLVALASTLVASPAKAKSFHFTGYYAETCSCTAPCPCELTGLSKGCQGVGAFVFKAGSFDGVNISGSKAAYATGPGEWVMIYVDAPTAAKRKAVSAMMNAALAGFGKIESTRNAKVSLTMKNGHYVGSIDGGKVCSFETTPTLGGDKKTPLVYSNVNDPFHPTVMQGNNVGTHFDDGGHTFDLKDSNAFFNGSLSSSGKL
ncbi:MAG: DUF1326 domain-containing protein [Armatimonadetes bacterium]|nr:DUF1326 domain-containing protein [Armatimonadota bacterium]